MPTRFNWGVCYVLYVCMKNCFCAISFEYNSALDLSFIHRYMIIKYRSISIKDKIHQLISELWSLISKLVSVQYIKNELIESDEKNNLG